MTALSRVRVTGPLAEYRASFQDALAGLGYAPLSAANHLRVMAHLSRWLAGRGIGAGELTQERVEEFLGDRRRAGYTCWLSERGLAPLLGHLRELGVTPEPVSVPVASGPVEEVLAAYRTYLLRERGLVASTVCYYEAEARVFLTERVEADGLDLDGLTSGDVTRFVVRGCAGRPAGSAKILVTALRSLLRYLFLVGLIGTELAAAVPGVAGWRGASLPRGLEPGQVTALLRSCDRRRAVGRRDYAVLTVLVRLGLRVGEVAGLGLADIDWRRGELIVRGKARRDERLPLPDDVGEALVGYLRRGRPRTESKTVFVAARAPYGALSAGAVQSVVRSACDRAGLPRVGAHRLRHTTATELLRAGASLPEVAQVLRHRSVSTTAIYAKVDQAMLRGLALPWPDGGAA